LILIKLKFKFRGKRGNLAKSVKGITVRAALKVRQSGYFFKGGMGFIIKEEKGRYMRPFWDE
jgi:hypothetical protein